MVTSNILKMHDLPADEISVSAQLIYYFGVIAITLKECVCLELTVGMADPLPTPYSHPSLNRSIFHHHDFLIST
jgi:hypothetical protein